MVVNCSILWWLWIALSLSLSKEISLFGFATPFKSFFRFTGLWHGWGVFVPNPENINRRLLVLIEYTDGTVDEWQSTAFEQRNWWHAFVQCRLSGNGKYGQLDYASSWLPLAA